ncbi:MULTISPECIES: LytR C-terminal domain-containing protein [Cryobacterium]|uniref:LytR family transcriptional regulator n=1 Tax=Cryobacterium breve TaxID=1259258 RepID=A0ABY2JAR2_9MICO|nr:MULTISPECIES: LytR C-terminal domain-containing protein [Cryobacterium]TFC96286.1 LytR family transcriptional regulator [Cryobacterium sp. TmT3-12]TFD00709.1 LytR family transcriptional regulator [Cryobacterium breve]
MPTSYAKDRFDHLPHPLDRVGAHRAPGKKGRRWIAFWWALGATVVLVGAGVAGLAMLNSSLNFELPGTSTAPSTAETSDPASTAEAPVPGPAATVDPTLAVTVLNGTAGEGVARSVGELLEAEGWTLGELDNASTEDVPTTIVYYADETLEGAARGVAASLPGSEVLLSSEFADSAAPLTVVVGNDYQPLE